MKTKFEIACITPDGNPGVATVTITCTEEQYDSGECRQRAYEWAENNGYKEPMFAFERARFTRGRGRGVKLI